MGPGDLALGVPFSSTHRYPTLLRAKLSTNELGFDGLYPVRKTADLAAAF